MVKVQSGHCPSSAPVPAQGKPGGVWEARYSHEEDRPLGAQPLPRVLEPAASKAAEVTAFDHSGGASEGRPRCALDTQPPAQRELAGRAQKEAPRPLRLGGERCG